MYVLAPERHILNFLCFTCLVIVLSRESACIAINVMSFQGRRKLVRTGAAIDWDIGGCARTFKVLPRKKNKNFREYFMMATVVYHSAEIAGAVVEILVGGARIESR